MGSGPPHGGVRPPRGKGPAPVGGSGPHRGGSGPSRVVGKKARALPVLHSRTLDQRTVVLGPFEMDEDRTLGERPVRRDR